MKIAVVGVPKTIDNDILLMDKTFGFDTAVEEAQRAINSAYIEVKSHSALLSFQYLHYRFDSLFTCYANPSSSCAMLLSCLLPYSDDSHFDLTGA